NGPTVIAAFELIFEPGDAQLASCVDGSDQAVEGQLVSEVADPVEHALPEALVELEQLLSPSRCQFLGDLEQVFPHLVTGPLGAEAGEVCANPGPHLERGG